MEKTFNKLVRDKIPEIIKNNGEVAYTRILDEKEYREELLKKIQEECNEVIGAESSIELLEECADVLEILRAIATLENKTLEDIIEIANIKRNKRGGFDERVFLEKTSDGE